MRVGREQHLTSVRGSQQPTGAVEHGPEVVAAARLYLSHVDGHPDPQRSSFAPRCGDESALDLARGGEGGADVGKREINAVPDTFDEASPGRLDGRHDEAVVLRDRGPHPFRVQLPQRGRVLDVGEQKCERLHLQFGLEQQRRVLVEDPPLQLPELRRRLEPEFVREVGARLLVGAQRLCLTAAAVEREHVLCAETLVDRELLAQHLQLRDEVSVAAERQLGLDARLNGAQPQLLETPRLDFQGKRSG
jgi:hypothetical protein